MSIWTTVRARSTRVSSSRLAVPWIVLALATTPGPSAAQQAAPVVARNAAGPIGVPTASALPNTTVLTLQAAPVPGEPPVLDGRMNDAAWALAEPATGFIQRAPDAGRPATQRTEVRVLYTDDALYIGARMFDTSPDSIVAQLARRDENVHSDWIFIGIDSYHDRRTAFVFAVNPRGVKRDFAIYDDRREDRSWDAVWDAATTTDSLGWTAELRIPLSQLRFSTGGDEAQRWGINFMRQIARRNEESFWAPTPPDAPGIVSSFGELHGLAGLHSPRRLELLPYSMARVTREPGAAADPFHRPTDAFGTLGADLKFGLTSNLTLTATFNPDFGQVEADPAQVNLSAFETFLTERRPFFVEGADLFDLDIGLGDDGVERIFYSRRIGRAPQRRVVQPGGYVDVPDAAPILGAAKLSGRTAGGWSLGALNAVAGRVSARVADGNGQRWSVPAEPLTSYSVARLGRDFNQGHSAVGAIATATHRRLDDDALDFLNREAYAGGLDARHRFGGGNYQAAAYLLGSRISGSAAAIDRAQRAAGRYYQRPDAEHLDYDPDRTSLTGASGRVEIAKLGGGSWRWGGFAVARSPGFEVNDLGFQHEADAILAAGYVAYTRFEPGPVLRRWSLSSSHWQAWNFGRETLQVGRNLNGNLLLPNYWGAWAGVNRATRGLSDGALRGGPAILRPDVTRTHFGVHTDRRRNLNAELGGNYNLEQESGGRTIALRPALNLRPSARVEMSLRPTLTRHRDGWQYVTAAESADGTRYVFARLDQTTASLVTRLSFTFTPDLSLQFYAQPFLSAGRYTRFMEVQDPRAREFDERFRRYTEDEVTYDAVARRYRIESDGDGDAAIAFGDPDFDVRQFRSNAVMRWEFRPGSTLFVVWSQGRRHFDPDGNFAPRAALRDLFRADASNVLALKVNYWLDF